jgi:hypothetical protein
MTWHFVHHMLDDIMQFLETQASACTSSLELASFAHGFCRTSASPLALLFGALTCCLLAMCLPSVLCNFLSIGWASYPSTCERDALRYNLNIRSFTLHRWCTEGVWCLSTSSVHHLCSVKLRIFKLYHRCNPLHLFSQSRNVRIPLPQLFAHLSLRVSGFSLTTCLALKED